LPSSLAEEGDVAWKGTPTHNEEARGRRCHGGVEGGQAAIVASRNTIKPAARNKGKGAAESHQLSHLEPNVK
jgi:hypothetical protein